MSARLIAAQEFVYLFEFLCKSLGSRAAAIADKRLGAAREYYMMSRALSVSEGLLA